MTPGKRFWLGLNEEQPLQIVGAVNAYCARLAEQAGFRCLYLSGGGVAASSCGIPDLGITTMEDVLTDARRITNITQLPLLVDIDTGWGGTLNIARTVKEFERAGVAAVHLEDQITQKRCGHRPNKAVVSTDEMCDRIKAATDARDESNFVIMARTDALQQFGIQAVVERICRYQEAGADAIFPEAITDYHMYQEITQQTNLPVLANLTEFGNTPMLTVAELKQAGVRMVLYPLSAFRAMSKAAQAVYVALRNDAQETTLASMQTRAELYDILGYHEWEQRLDNVLDKG